MTHPTPSQPHAERMDAARSVLLLVDYQQRLLPAIFEGERVLAHALLLARTARELGVPVLGTEQNPAGLGPTAPLLRERCEQTLSKMHFDACADGLDAWLVQAAPGRSDVVMAGCEAHVCLLQTALGLLRAGRHVWVDSRASGSRSPLDQALAMERLARAGATIVSTEMVVFEWLHHCRHERFKSVLAELKRTAE